MICQEEYHRKLYDHNTVIALMSFTGDNNIRRLMITTKVLMDAYKHFKGFDAMEKFVEKHKKVRRTIFDINWKDTKTSDFEKFFLTILGANVDEADNDRNFAGDAANIINFITTRVRKENAFDAVLLANQAEHGEFITKMFRQIFGAMKFTKKVWVPRFMLSDGGSHCSAYEMFHPATLLLQHSCDANVMMHSFDGNKIALIVNRPVKDGDQLCVNYNESPHAIFAESDLNRVCELTGCVPCTDAENDRIDPVLLSRLSNIVLSKATDCMESDMLTSGRSLEKMLKACYDFINENYDKEFEDREGAVRKKIFGKWMEISEILGCLQIPFYQGAVASGLRKQQLMPEKYR